MKANTNNKTTYAVFKEVISQSGVKEQQITYFKDIDSAEMIFDGISKACLYTYKTKKALFGRKLSKSLVLESNEKNDDMYKCLIFATKGTEDVFFKLFVTTNPEKYI